MQSLPRTLIWIAAASFVAAAWAQEPPDNPPADADADRFYGSEPTQGVYVRDSAVALEKFPLVARLERLRDWGKAADVLQEVLEKYPDRVIQTASDERGRVVRYTSVAHAVQQQIAKWPAEGLAAYRARFEAPAEAILSAAEPDDVQALRRVYSAYFNTDAGKRAGMRLVDVSFRSGDFQAAADVADELLAWHPLLGDDRPAALFRAALAHHLAHHADRAQACLDELKSKHADATGLVRGRQVRLAETLEAELKRPPADARALSADHWPMLGGDDSRGRISAARGRTGARLFQVPLIDRISPQVHPDMRASIEAQDELARSQGALLGVIPATDRGELYFQDGKRIVAVSLESGLPLPGWAETYGGDSAGAYVDPDTTPLPTGQQLTVTLTDHEVLAIMGLPERQALYGGGRTDNQLSRLVCLDRASGRVKWIVTPRDLPEDGGSLRDLVFSGSPLVVGDNVHFIGRGGKSTQFEDCYVITVNLADGKYKWSTYIASANSENMNVWGAARAVALPPERTSHLAHAGGRLFVLTNLGAVASLDAYSGTIRWLSIYERNVQTDLRAMRRMARRQSIQLPRPWTYNPVIARGGRLFMLPGDSDHLLVYDAATGEAVQRIVTEHLGSPDTLIGASDDSLIVGGEYRVSCLDWRRYDPATFRDNDPAVFRWICSFPDAGEDVINPIRGRAFLTSDSVFVPTQRGLFRLDLATGRRVEQYPAGDGRWTDEEGPGNVIVTADRVIVAGERAVSVYTDLAMARAKLDAGVAAAPNDPDPRLRYAEVMFVAGQSDVALAKLDEAIELMGGADELRPGPGRDRLFTAALSFAERTAAGPSPESVELARQLYDRAGRAAASPAQHVNYRLSRARFAAATRDLPEVVRLYQEILLDEPMRQVTLNDARAGGATPAAVVAEREIAQVVREAGRGIYAPHETRAAEALRAARTDGRPEELLDVARRFPNATVAPDALLAAADAYERAGDHRRATQTLRQITFKYGESIDRIRVIEAMARNYLAMGRHVDVALSRLTHGARLRAAAKLAQPLPLPDGNTLPAGTRFADAVKALRDHRDAAASNIPAFGLPGIGWTRSHRGQMPLAMEDHLVIPGVAAVVAAQDGYGRHDRIVTWSPGQGVAIYDIGAAEPRGRASTITEAPREAAWSAAGLLLRTAGQLALLDGDTAEVKWSVRIEAMPEAELVQSAPAPRPTEPPQQQVAMEGIVVRGQVRIINNRMVPQQILPAPQPIPGPEQFVQMRLTGDRVLATTSTGRLVALELSTGRLAWQTRLLDGVPLDRLAANDDFAVVRIIGDGFVHLAVFDTLNGDPVARRAFSPDRMQVPLNFALAGDGTLVWILPDRLCAKDLYEPGEQLSWEVPAQGPGRPVLLGAIQPDHLQIDGDRVLVLSDDGQFVRVHSLETGKLLRYRAPGEKRETEMLLGTEAKGWDVRLLLHSPHLYVLSNRSLVAYNLDAPHQTWHGPMDPTESHNFRQAMVGADHLVLFESLAQAAEPQASSTTYRLHAFSRVPTRKGESGVLTHLPEVRDPAGIETWLGVDGGFYYLAADRNLHFLPAVRE